MDKTYEVKGMSCVICKNTVETGLKKINGVNDCKVNLLENEAFISYDENKVNEAILSKTVSDLGYELVINPRKQLDYKKILMIVSIVLVIILMYLSMGHMINLPTVHNSKYYQLIICSIIILLNIDIYKSGFMALFHLRPNMNSLVSLSSFVSYIYSLIVFNNTNYHIYFETSAMVLVIVSIGKYIEGINKKKATKTIRGLATLIPMQANLITSEGVTIIPIDDLKVNDIVEVKPGESIPQDGIIVLGQTSIDESMITGESLPVNKTLNDGVIGGSINIDGSINVKITKPSGHTTISKIISLTKQATMKKIPIERLSDTISKYFVYVVMTIAIITFIIWYIYSSNIELSLNFALSVLVISCPCALGLATPSAISVAIGLSGKNGILIKNPEILEIAYKLSTIILDKTGTLTNNSLKIIDIKEYDKDFINVLSSLEKSSNHPISNAIVSKYDNGSLIFDKFEQIPAQGIVAYINNDIYYAGNDILANKYININDYSINKDYSYIIVGKNNALLGIVYLADQLKQSSIKAIDSLKNRNIKPIMATGDNKLSADHIASRLGIDEYYYSYTPDDKSKLVLEKKKDGLVGVAGDGINDAIALSNSDVSFSLANGSDIAYASSDVVLMNNDINDINFLVDVSRKTMRIIKQNLFWALFYNSLFIPLAAGLFYNSFNLSLNPMIGALTMSISSIIVISNSLRINSIKKEETRIMNKTVLIEGMMCNNCVRHVKEALEALGCEVNVVLEDSKAYIANTSLTDAQIKLAIEQAGYTVKEITNG